MQHTLKRQISLSGTGLHSGASVTMTLRPAPAGSGIVFIRTDLSDRDNVIPALWDRVVDTRLCTVIANAAGASVGTIEHLMAVLRGCAVDNLFVELNGPEVPVMDGSAEPFVTLIDEAGLQVQDKPRRAIRVLKEVVVEEGDKSARLTPGEGSVFSGKIDFTHPSIGVQTREIRLLNGNFRHDIASSRTFGFLHEVETLRKHGLALGGSLENAIVLDDVSILNPDGLRHQDEFIRHKLLDAVGDIYLAGAPLLGAYDGHKAGHALNNALLRKLFATEGAWDSVTVSSQTADTV